MNLRDRVAVVTGAGRGLGRSISVRLAQRGADVVLAARTAGDLEATARLVREEGREAVPVPTDVGDPDQVAELARVVLQRFGRVDVLVNNAGIRGPTAPLWETDPADWEQVVRVNLTAAFLCSRAFVPAMIRAGSGSIVNVGSIATVRARAGRVAYAASKSGLAALTRGLAVEAGEHGVRVNMVSPGVIAGERLDRVLRDRAAASGTNVEDEKAGLARDTALRRLITGDEIADVVVFLASDLAAGVTGHDIDVSAGSALG